MEKRKLHFKNWLTLSTLTVFFSLSTPANAQSVPGQNNRPVQDNDASRQELARFDGFLNSHPEIADQLRKDPSLVNNEEFMKNHPALQTYLEDHPGLRRQLKENPNAFMHAEDRFDRREDNRDREEMANFDRFLDSHRETAEQLRKNPSLVDNGEFVKNHPALQTYLEDHPGVREQLKQDPNAFMQKEARYYRPNDMNHDMDRDEVHRHFGEFLGGHPEISQQLTKDPSLVANQKYLENHPELQEYLNAHPEARQAVVANPQSFVKSSQQFNTNTGQTVKAPTASPKPNQ